MDPVEARICALIEPTAASMEGSKSAATSLLVIKMRLRIKLLVKHIPGQFKLAISDTNFGVLV